MLVVVGSDLRVDLELIPIGLVEFICLPDTPLNHTTHALSLLVFHCFRTCVKCSE